ncbi:MAG: hypothetical protein CMJ84_00130 [Planctomycetes bacterium]|nr:hypothetical protein [Planctomycetota bacterium]
MAAAPARALLAAYVEGVLQQPPRLTSVVLAVQMACNGIFALAGGAVADLAGRRTAVLIGLTVGVTSGLLIATRSPWLLIGLAVLSGIAMGFHSTGGQSYLLAISSTARLGMAAAVFFLTKTASQAGGALIAGYAADRLGFQSVGLVAALLGLVVLVAAVLWLPAAPAAPSTASTPATKRLWVDTGYGRLLRRPGVLALGAVRFLPTTAWGAASLAFPLLIYRLSQSATTVGLFGTVSLLAASAAQLATGRAIDRVGPRVLVLPLAVSVLACSLLAVALGHSIAGLFISGTLWTMTAWGLSITMPPLIHQLGRGRDDGRLVAITHALWSAGMLSGTLAGGELIERAALAPFAFAAGCLVLTCLTAFWFTRVTSGPRQPVGEEPV